MAKIFNVTGPCIPAKHYMTDVTERIGQIREMVDAGYYFTINRARQYGKTTTLVMLDEELGRDYLVIRLDFQSLGSASFRDENVFSLAFLRIVLRELRWRVKEDAKIAGLIDQMQVISREKNRDFDFMELFEYLMELCKSSIRPVVLIIDEVDSASNNQVFLDFLAQLRSCYLERETKGAPAFQAVILAGVYDIKNLRRKLRPEEEHKTNSPWNIAADFNIEMGLSKNGIEGMLKDYEADHRIRMDIDEIAGLLYDYTSGYPYLVSRLCKLMDEKASNTSAAEEESVWTKEGFLEVVRILLLDNNTLFESLTNKLTDYPELGQMLKELLFSGKSITYNPTNPVIHLALMFGFVKNDEGKVIPANRIFDTFLYNHFLSLDEMGKSDIYKASLQDKNQFICDGKLDMRRVLEKFVWHFHELYGGCEERFLEEEGRRYFLLYLRPIINGMGNYYIEARTRSLGRTDIIVDYGNEQFVIETKIWRGNEYHSRGERQLEGYLDDYNLQTGYMLSFNFNRRKQIGVHEIRVGDKVLIEAIV